MACPIALFYFNNAKDLIPVAIQLFQPDEPTQMRLKVLSEQLEHHPGLHRRPQVVHMNQFDDFLDDPDHDHAFISRERDAILAEFPVSCCN